MSNKLEEHDKDVTYYKGVRALFWMIVTPVIIMDFFWPEILPETWDTFFRWLIAISFFHYLGAAIYFGRKYLK